jgi:hypothetical protein
VSQMTSTLVSLRIVHQQSEFGHARISNMTQIQMRITQHTYCSLSHQYTIALRIFYEVRQHGKKIHDLREANVVQIRTANETHDSKIHTDH